MIERLDAINPSEKNNIDIDTGNDPKNGNTKVTEKEGTNPTVKKANLTESKGNPNKSQENPTVKKADHSIKKTNPTGNEVDKIVPKPICTSTPDEFRTQLTSSNTCAPLFKKQNKCCVMSKEEFMLKVNRPLTIQGILDMLRENYNKKKQMEEFLVKHNYNISRRNNIVDPNIWNELQEELPDIANFLMYGMGCDVPLESIQDMYRDKLTDNSVCFVNFIIKSIKKLNTLDGPIKLVEEITKTFDLKYICDIIYNEKTIPFLYENSKKHLLVYNGLKNTIPKKCDVYHTLYLCIGLVLNRHMKPSTQSNNNIAMCFGYEGTLIPYQVSEQSIMLLFKYIQYFPQLSITPNNEKTNSLLSCQKIQASTDRTKSISIVHTGMRIESPVDKIPHISLERLIKVPDELTLRNCNIGDKEIAIILTNLRERSLKILDVGNNPIQYLPKLEKQNGHILNYLAMDLCSIDTNAVAICLHVCKGVVNVSGNKNVRWANLSNNVKNINAKELIIFDCGSVNISNAFENIEKLYFSNGIVSGLSSLKLLACSMDTMTNDQKNKIFELSTTTLTDLIIGGTSKTGTQFKSSLDRRTSFELERIIKKDECMLEVMCLSHCNINNIDSIITNTKHLKTLKELYIADMDLHGKVIGSALSVLLSNNTLKVLGINNNRFCNESISNIGIGLRNNKSLARLHMSNVPIYDSTLQMFEQIKDFQHQLEVLEIGGNDKRSLKKDETFFPLLLSYISNFTNINMLKCSNLIQNDYDDKLATSLGSLMKKCANMRHLDLSNCNLNLLCLSTLFVNLHESQITQLFVNNNAPLGLSQNDALVSDMIKSLNNNNTELACLSINKIFTSEMKKRIVNYVNLKYPHVIVHA